jgi:hypothetical protein
MKKSLLVFFFLIINYSLLIINCCSQLPPHYYWQIIPSPVQTNLNNIFYINSSSPGELVFGDNGVQLYSTNGGLTFQQLYSLPNLNFYSSFILNGNTVVGQNGAVYFSQGFPPGAWVQQTSGTNADLYSVSGQLISVSPSTNRRIAAGSNGTILKSSMNPPNGWSDWSQVVSGTSQDLFWVFLGPGSVSPKGWITGNNGTLLKTTNGGDNWNSINIGVTNKLNYVTFIDTSTGLILGSGGLILRTTNGGDNWTTINSGTSEELKSFTSGNSELSLLYAPTYFICGANGVILKSTNIGASWTFSNSPVQNNLNSGFMSVPIIVGNSGTIIKRAADSSYSYKKLEENNISSFFYYRGIFDQDRRNGNLAGFEWPKGSGKKAVFTAGLSIAAYSQGQLREAMASYGGEYIPGICNNGIAQTNDTFKLYSVKRGDGPSTNTDWLNWGLMVPYGAPFVDVNNNGIYDPQIDTAGVRGASQTIFVCYTDGFPNSHMAGEGFGGGTAPLFAEVHLTAWCYSQLSYTDMQFLKFVIINKGAQPWTRTYFSLVSDPDLGNANDDYIGCDTTRKLTYCYNSTNNDPVYGTAPPAVGFLILKGAYSKYTNPPKQLDMTSFIYFSANQFALCEGDPVGEPTGAYHFMQGFKKDSSCWLDPTQLVTPPNFYKKTKFIYPGDPETNTGWTEYKGSINNCWPSDSSGTPIIPNIAGDRRMAVNSGAENLTVMPGDTQTIVICQLIAKGSSNLNSVTKLKQLADVAIQFYNSGYVIGINKISSEVPTAFRLEQNYPNPFNPVTKIRFSIPPLNPPLVKVGSGMVTLKVYDITGREIQTLVKEKLNPGTYEVTFDCSNLASGVYFYQLKVGDYINTRKMILLK